MTAFTTLKMELVAPMPRARVSTATAVNPGDLCNKRSPYRRSERRLIIDSHLKGSRVSSLPRHIPNVLRARSFHHKSKDSIELDSGFRNGCKVWRRKSLGSCPSSPASLQREAQSTRA